MPFYVSRKKTYGYYKKKHLKIEKNTEMQQDYQEYLQENTWKNLRRIFRKNPSRRSKN